MAHRKGGAMYDDDDLDDYDEDYEDDDYWEEGDADDAPVAAKPANNDAKPAAGGAAGASAFARGLTGPPPKLPSGKPQPSGKSLPQAKQINMQPHPVAPPPSHPQAGKPFSFDTPSPDDAVLAAQRQRTGGTAAEATSSTTTAVSQKMAGMGLEGPAPAAAAAPAPASKPAVPPPRPLGEYRPDAELAAACAAASTADATPGSKPRLHLVVLGHVDAGKSTLMGRMLYELGHVEEKAVHRAKRDAAAAGKASFAWAWMLDERPEERARGVTVDVAVTRFETPQRIVTLLDAPGHRDFVPNMIAGAAQADAALLVVDGSPGGFESGFAAPAPGSPEGGGQTREHAQLARSLGVEQAAVVVTKLDTCEFSQARFEEIKAQMEPFLRSCGFKPGSLQWLPAVGPSGENLAKPPSAPALAAWYTGPTLAAAIDAFSPAHRLVDRPLRMPVAEVAARGSKGVVTIGGKIEGGALRPGSRVLVMPSRELATVKSIEVEGRAAAVARAGDSADVALTGIDSHAVHVGFVLCHPDFPVPLATSLLAEVVVLDVAIPLLKGQQVTLHAHAARDSGHVSRLVAQLDAKTGEVVRQRPRCLVKGHAAVIEITPSRPLPIECYSDYRSLGRVALRDGGRTLAVGIVTQLNPHHNR